MIYWYVVWLINSCCSLINHCFSEVYDFTQITLRVCKPCTRRCYQNEFCATRVHSLLPFRFECSTGTCFDPILVLVVFVIISPFAYQYSNFLQAMCVCWIPYKLPSCGEDDDLSLITNDIMVSILMGNYAGKVWLFVCFSKSKALVNL